MGRGGFRCGRASYHILLDLTVGHRDAQRRLSWGEGRAEVRGPQAQDSLHPSLQRLPLEPDHRRWNQDASLHRTVTWPPLNLSLLI